MSKKYWYISYLAIGFNHGDGTMGAYNNETIDISPAEWAINMSEEGVYGPYIILYAEELTKKQYEELEL